MNTTHHSDDRNETAHPNGNILFSTRVALDAKMAEILHVVNEIQTHSKCVIEQAYRDFLRQNHAPEECEYPDDAEFPIFIWQAGEDGIEVRVAEGTVWLTQKLMAALFEVTIPTINEDLSNLYSHGAIVKGSTIRNFRTVQKEGGR